MDLFKIVYRDSLKNLGNSKYGSVVECTIFVDTIKNYKRQIRTIADLRSANDIRKIELVYDESQDMVTAMSYILSASGKHYHQDNWNKEFTFHMDHYETDERAYEMLLEILTTSYSEYMKSERKRV